MESDAATIRSWVEELQSEAQREAIRLSVFEGWKTARIAERMEKSRLAVRMLVFHGLRAIRRRHGPEAARIRGGK